VAVDGHMPAILAARGRVVALADIVEERAVRIAREHEVPDAFGDHQELVACPEVDVVAVCTPPSSHAAIARAALEAGKHVYVEKPPTMNEQEMARVAAGARHADRLMLVGSNGVYHNEIQALKRRIRAGDLGDIYYVECLRVSQRRLPHGWKRERRFGSGIVMDGFPHRLDQVLYLLDAPAVVSVTARTYDRFAGHPARSSYLHADDLEGRLEELPVAEVEDTAVAFVQFETGCTLLLKDAYAGNAPEEWRSVFYGTRAGARLYPSYGQPQKPSLTLYEEGSDGPLRESVVDVPPGPDNPFTQAWEHFFDCIGRGCQTESPPDRAVLVMRIIDAVHRSATEGGRQVVCR
jgi:predicted dehydrogenase